MPLLLVFPLSESDLTNQRGPPQNAISTPSFSHHCIHCFPCLYLALGGVSVSSRMAALLANSGVLTRGLVGTSLKTAGKTVVCTPFCKFLCPEGYLPGCVRLALLMMKTSHGGRAMPAQHSERCMTIVLCLAQAHVSRARVVVRAERATWLPGSETPSYLTGAPSTALKRTLSLH